MAYGFNDDKSRAEMYTKEELIGEGLLKGLNAQIRKVKVTLTSVSPNSWKSNNIRFATTGGLQDFNQHDPSKICILSVNQGLNSQNFLYNNRIFPYVQIIPNVSSGHTMTVYGYNDGSQTQDISLDVTLLFID